MKTVKFEKARSFLKGKGFAFALVLSLAAVGGSTYFAYDRALSKLGTTANQGNTNITETFADPDIPVVNEQFGVPKQNETKPAVTTEPAEKSIPGVYIPTSPTNVAALEREKAKEAARMFDNTPVYTVPVKGEISVPYSNGELVKSKTLGVWKTHDGVDIKAANGTAVNAFADGKVSKVYADPLWGVCVEIDHGDGLVSYYYGLDRNVPVNVGQAVLVGDVIALTGGTAEIEIAEEPHLHFAVKQDGAWIDPLSLLT
ncbi:MAG: M23 family metallopeptidase [Oscillospiraceae bacterium]|jgi:murein DD-endopeptidase MepM/ murein hydrolase activator NlpD|nr:M23 family metallopeptidase [Oscillospiraceae bacterium]